jgi:hypothetical protein
MCWNICNCGVNKFQNATTLIETGFGDFLATYIRANNISILGILEVRDGPATAPGQAWYIGKYIVNCLNESAGSSGKWDFRISSRQYGYSECVLFIWDGLSVQLDETTVPGPVFSINVVNADALASLQNQFGYTDNDTHAIVKWIVDQKLTDVKITSKKRETKFISYKLGSWPILVIKPRA